MTAENVLPLLIPILVLIVLWTVVRHWILPFVLGFALAVALGPSARPLMAGAWSLIAGAGDRVFGSDTGPVDERWEERRRSRQDYEDVR